MKTQPAKNIKVYEGVKMSSYFSNEELSTLGLKSYGNNVQISRFTRIYGPENIEIGNNVRIDDFCFLSGKIILGNYIHIAPFSELIGGKEGIELDDFSGLSSRVTLYAASDDYSGNFMTNPTIPDKYLNVMNKKIKLGKHVIIGAASLVLPGVIINEGTAIGACSLVNKSCKEWSIYKGIPAKYAKERSKELLKLEKEMETNVE